MSARNTTAIRKALRNFCVVTATTLVLAVQAQVAFPDQYIQDVAWNEGWHHYTLAQPIIAPGYAPEPTVISGTANAEFVSGTSVHLTEGFHAGNFSSEGHFRARIDEGIDGADAVAIITPAPDHIIDGMLHVKKWEKLEVGLKLPQPYLAAIESFFGNYYPFDPNDAFGNKPRPGDVDITHDLNPYADDSLQVYMVLTDPNNEQRMKWAFYMKEVTWGPGGEQAKPKDDPDSPLDDHRMRFRYAPDMEGPWTFRIGIRAPHTLDVNDVPLPEVNYTTYSFYCDPPPEGKHGPLHVNTANNRMLEHEDTTPFFGMGTNMADVIHHRGPTPFGAIGVLYRRDFEVMKLSMEQLHEVGGNFMRMMQTQEHFAHEVINLGVYDRYQGLVSCEPGQYTQNKGDCQHHSWNFDQLLEHAAYNNIYIQLCVDPNKPNNGGGYLWEAVPYVTQFLDTDRNPDNTFDLKKFFYKNGQPSTRDEPNVFDDRNVFYFWKRKYKYLMNRWGYSPHLAIIEPFNEIDAMLGYHIEHILTSGVCELNQRTWPVEENLRETLDVWLTDIKDYMTGEVDLDDPVASPLGENKLMTVSYTLSDPVMDVNDRLSFYKPFYNEKVDLMDAHHYLGPNETGENQPDVGLDFAVGKVHDWLDQTQPGHFPSKPYNTGEHNHITNLDNDGLDGEIEKVLMNYDVSFHNEIWSGAFSGKWATGSTWNWERVFWWEDGLPAPPDDAGNFFQQDNFSNELGMPNSLDIGTDVFPVQVLITNRRLHHHFKPLADLLGDQLWLDYGFFNGNFTQHKVFDIPPIQPTDDLESYYLVRESNYPSEDQNLAIGWVHNRNAWSMNNYYVKKSNQNFLGCTPPTPSSSITLTGFAPYTDLYVTWFPTRSDSPVLPAATPTEDPLQSTGSGDLTIDFEPGQFGDIVNGYMDTLRTDYAFIISPEPFFKSRQPSAEPEHLTAKTDWDFSLFPNPTRDELFLKLPDDAPMDILLYDLSGRQVQTWGNVSGPVACIRIGTLSRGAYTVRVTKGVESRTNKLILH